MGRRSRRASLMRRVRKRVVYGVNLCGAEFGAGNLPGTYDVHYTYPTTQEIDYFAGKGMKIIRLGCMWERLQTSANAALNSTEMGRMDTIVDYAATKGMKVVINPHNFNRYFGTIVGVSGGVANSVFADFWSRVATHYLADSHVIFGLTNEPNGSTTAEWLATANAAIAAIRAAGSTHRVYVPGNSWSTAGNWTAGDNDTVLGPGIVDSGNNHAIELHNYFDSDASGETDAVVSNTIGSQRLAGATTWARANGKKLFLGEFGCGQGTDSLTTLDDMCDFLDANADVWEAATYWAAGPWWGNDPPASYEFWVIEPANLGTTPVDKPQMAVLVDHINAS